MFSPQPWLFKINLQSVYIIFPSDEHPNDCAFDLVRVWSLESLVNDLVEKYPHILTLGSASAQGKRMVQCLAYDQLGLGVTWSSKAGFLFYERSHMATHRNILKQHGFCFSNLQLRRVLAPWLPSTVKRSGVRLNTIRQPMHQRSWQSSSPTEIRLKTPCTHGQQNPYKSFVPFHTYAKYKWNRANFLMPEYAGFWPVDFIWMQQHT